MSILGVDSAWSKPTVAQLQSIGAHFVIGYITHDNTGKALSRSDVETYHNAGFAVGLVFEDAADRATAGRAAGVADAQYAVAVLASLGLPVDMPVYFACDFDGTWSEVADYMAGAASVIGKDRVGVYGGIAICQGAVNNGYGFIWQTVAWSNGQWATRTNLRQYAHTYFGGGSDQDWAETTDWGQYPRPSSPPPPPPPVQEDDMPYGMLPAGFAADQNGTVHDDTLVAVVPVDGQTKLNLAADFGTAKVRVALHHSTGWSVTSYVVDSTKPVMTLALSGIDKVSLAREMQNATDTLSKVPVAFSVN